MRQLTLERSKKTASAPTINSVISFQPFYRYLKQKIKTEQTVKAKLYQTLLEKIESYPELKKPVEPKNLSKYEDLYELIYACMTGITTEDTESLWGLGAPKPGRIFYGTDNLCCLFLDYDIQSKDASNGYSPEEHLGMERAFIYSLILSRYYDFNPLVKNEMIHSLIDPETQLSKYYRVNVDTRFVEISHKGALPALDFKKIEEQVHNNTLVKYLLQVLPLNNFTFTGFNIVYFTEFTEQYAIQLIKNMLLERNTKPKEQKMFDLIQVLKTIAGCKDVEYGFIPFVRLNHNLLLDFGQISSSVLLDFHKKTDNKADSGVQSILESFMRNPQAVLLNNSKSINEEGGKLAPILELTGMKAFALLPLFHNSELTGVLEVYARREKILTKKLLIKIDATLPYIAQLMDVAVDNFQSMITRTVTEKFTSIQPAVHWRFREAAWSYLYDCLIEKKEIEIEHIAFEQLYPLYGAIDIRNSSVERNQALEADMRYQLNLLAETFAELKAAYPLPLLDKMIYECHKWLNHLESVFSAEESIHLNYFLEKEAWPALLHFKTLHPDSAAIVQNYCSSLNEETGKSHENRRNLEISTQMITKSLDAYFDAAETELQKSYPFYFEKYRTDGVEYDIFMGQSLAPHKAFDRIYLNNLRLWQLQSMAEISRLIQNMQPKMPKPLQVTLLIYVNSDPIDIHFRNDEKRFDVEGGYNVRYQMIKKRIDKVHIKQTNERLTQPGKIALVYSNKQDALEYISHIRYLQAQGILQDDLEELELEELQGVSGLRALRVGTV